MIHIFWKIYAFQIEFFSTKLYLPKQLLYNSSTYFGVLEGYC